MMNVYLSIGSVIFGCGVLGFLIRRNLILMFLSLELMLLGVSLNLVAFGRQHDDLGGQTFTIFVLTVAACEAALALALIVRLHRSRGSLDVNVWQSLREGAERHPQPHLDMMTAFERGSDAKAGGSDMPKLTPAGHDPLKFPAPTEIWQHDPAGMA